MGWNVSPGVHLDWGADLTQCSTRSQRLKDLLYERCSLDSQLC